MKENTWTVHSMSDKDQTTKYVQETDTVWYQIWCDKSFEYSYTFIYWNWLEYSLKTLDP